MEPSRLGLAPVGEARGLIPAPGANRFGERVQALGKIVGGVVPARNPAGGRSRGGLDVGVRQMRARILSDRPGGFAFGAADERDGAFDLAGGELLAAGGQEQGQLQGRRQQAELVSGHGAELAGLNEGTKIHVEATNEPQSTLHPGGGALQESGHGRGPHPVPIREFLHQPRLFPQGDGSAAGIEREHQRFGLAQRGRKDSHRELWRALGLENGPTLEAVDQFQAAVQPYDRQRFPDVGRKTAGGLARRIGLQPPEFGADCFDIHVGEFHNAFSRRGLLDFLRFLAQ